MSALGVHNELRMDPANSLDLGEQGCTGVCLVFS